MIPYMVGKLAPNSSHLTRGLVKYVPGRDYFCVVSSPNGDKYVTYPPPPQSLKSYRRDMKDQGDSGERRNECRQVSVRLADVYPRYLKNRNQAEREAQGTQGSNKNCKKSMTLCRVLPEVDVTVIIVPPFKGPMGVV